MTYHLIVPPALLESAKEAFVGMDVEVHASPYIPKENTAFIINLDQHPRRYTLDWPRQYGKTAGLEHVQGLVDLMDDIARSVEK